VALDAFLASEFPKNLRTSFWHAYSYWFTEPDYSKGYKNSLRAILEAFVGEVKKTCDDKAKSEFTLQEEEMSGVLDRLFSLQNLDAEVAATARGSTSRGLNERVDTKKIKEDQGRFLMLVTALAPVIGYDKASKIVREAMDNDLTLKAAALKLGLVTEADEFDRVVDPNKIGQTLGAAR
jgi:hypothetical protein